ncbi:ComEC/Rec2 family competence protein [Novosphingobium sp.]|uniref:ComEC/Rec2 family competence protein n=1 Tax=Novosphingobium sp. TaxID=1874826 RepID=UPI0027360E09|nr:ComEC/Rec2 family competence protein [Novosphingobium sp.]MDP3906032.1 ComEC/Rec2 family competence protein [Novosphingobium sp.]
MASGLASLEQFLERAGFDRAPWLVAAFGAGIAAWFLLANHWQWLGLLAACGGVALGALAALRPDGRFPYLRQALATLALMVALGCLLVWGKSAVVGTPAISRPMVTVLAAKVIHRIEQPAEGRVRLLLATRNPEDGRAIRVRVNLPLAQDNPAIAEGASVRLRARLMPPAPPMLPGGYDFARAAWFSGLAATGSVLGEVTVTTPAEQNSALRRSQRFLSAHVRSNLAGSPGTIAAAFASGDRGAIAETDDEAMRHSGLTHLLSISGLHVSAIIAAAYFLASRLLGLWGWLALRVRIPLVAAATGALTGIGYTLLTGAEVPTIRSCIGAVLVLGALALGREPLSLRLLAAAAFAVLLLWPEALIGPSFQMSFAAVASIIALHGTARMRAFMAPREEPWWARGLRNLAAVVLTGLVIELALMPIGLFHFHQSGVYGALANVVAIPLTTFLSMPLIALALLFDLVGAGAPFWWLTGKSLEALLGLAHWTAAMPGAVTRMPSMGQGAFALFVAGGVWLALWHGRIRLAGLIPAGLGALLLTTLQPPDVLISSDGRHVGITGEVPEELLMLRDSRSDFAKDNLTELAGMAGETRALSQWRGARCNPDFCAIRLVRGGRSWDLLMTRGKDMAAERELAAACDRTDIVISDRYLPRSCRPRWLKADRRMLDQTGGLTIDLSARTVRTVAESQGQHGWWAPPPAFRAGPRPAPPSGAATAAEPAPTPAPAPATTVPLYTP